jgi:nitrite reductase/ring-hydroxylating ferredoxin subunit
VPVVVVRTHDGSVGCLVNACTHRALRSCTSLTGTPLAGVLRCNSHAWSFDLEGRCNGVSLPDSFPGDLVEYRLSCARVETVRGLVFLTLGDAAPPLADYLGELTAGIELALGDGRLRLSVSRRRSRRRKVLRREPARRLPHFRAAPGEPDAEDEGARRDPEPALRKYGHVWHVHCSHPPELLRDMSLVELRTRAEPVNTTMNVFPQSMVPHQLDTLFLRDCIPRGVDRTEIQLAVFARRRNERPRRPPGPSSQQPRRAAGVHQP